jgi:hypothetical protein
MDFDKISDRIATQKESFIFYDLLKESEETKNLEDDLNKCIQELEKLPDFSYANEIENFGKDGTLLKKLRPSNLDDEKILKMETEIQEMFSKEKGKIGGFFSKLGNWTKKFFMTILKGIGKLAYWIKRLLMSCVFWFCRKVFRLSHANTSFYGPAFMGFVVASIIGIILAPIFATGVALFTGGAIISAITGAISGALNANIYVKVTLYIGYMIWWFINMKDSKDYTSFMEFIDGIEKLSGKKIKMDYDTRQFFINLDWEHNTKMNTPSKLGSKVSKQNAEQIQTTKIRISRLHMILAKYLKVGLQNITNDFPIFAKMVKGAQVKKEDREMFAEWVKDYVSGLKDFRTKYGDNAYKMAVQQIHKTVNE